MDPRRVEPAICCPECENLLVFHQPDPELPNRLLATCDECKAWFIADEYFNSLIALPRNPRDDRQVQLDW